MERKRCRRWFLPHRIPPRLVSLFEIEGGDECTESGGFFSEPETSSLSRFLCSISSHSLMADQNVQDPKSLAEDTKFVPLEKGAMAEKTLVGYKKATKSESDISDDGEDFDAQILEKLQKEAFSSVLLAFSAENTTFSSLETSIVERLMQEWNISRETQIALVNNIQKYLLAQEQQQRVDASASNEKKVEIVEESPLTKSGNKANSSLNSVAGSSSKWGRVNPETLVGKYVRVKTGPGKDDFEEFIIKEYDSEQEKHRLELADSDSDAMEMDDVLSWIDVTRIPRDDIVWERGIRPNFDAPNQRSTQGAFF